MNLQELIKTRINENVASYDKNIIERYEYLIEMIAIEYQSEQLRLLSVMRSCRCSTEKDELKKN